MRLLSLFSVSLCLLLISTPVRAQPPSGGERPFLDLDDDGTTDFGLKSTQMMGNEDVMSFEVMIAPKRKNQVVAQKQENPRIGDKERFVTTFEKGYSIGKALPDTLEWAPKVPLPPKIYDFVSDLSVPWKGPWPSEEAQYLGLKLVKNGKTYYGWAKLRLDRKYAWAVSIREKAYNPRPGRPIRAGHKK